MAAQPPSQPDAELDFWQERRICFLSTPRPEGTPHLVPVGVTYDPETRIARVISSRTSKKVRNILAAGPDVTVAVSQAEGRRWSTLEGTAVIKDDPQSVADAEARYARRYKQPRLNPERVVIEITVTKAMGTAKPPGW
ncbi:pyridoxamine 5'-phosphate oxidase family protein [Streptomyces sp. Je 1-4]|uniref:pyridoxamine 5'-phosphate oxidase family protein n=1 Tax=Streptomyces TaxID=1883 RepID=UPI0021DA6ADA|nr:MULTISPECIES: pyridoxamine 5'-phosphate oxidase family protein [unclassified Streptomyces]UYB40925.1 pyridoxamine 5'-phosphate oxidase family protein [Streptomyces sp. Je 1-4]UZQ37085.1 pyridoxamine 5'-phosphate oxidase family protein [Streptomyces sp. Je 1-4] [Streptomyces sp. Je 1-4 4N24]UZQ44502.1 pyridoxamine 5'-phosphate oxidase family protein [Streptomyces sp. Je 1-4] [Streptomyces sp. Je 1-4 4N24_ara]